MLMISEYQHRATHRRQQPRHCVWLYVAQLIHRRTPISHCSLQWVSWPIINFLNRLSIFSVTKLKTTIVGNFPVKPLQWHDLNALAATIPGGDAPNQKWVADFTYIWTAEGWLYVAAVLDLYSRRVVGWSMQSSMTSQLVADALMMAVWRRGKPQELLHHSDQGSQYTSEHFQKLLAEQGVTCSMSRAGEVWDNSAMESFFSTLKIERVHRKVYRTRAQARADVFDFIEVFYNPKRRHSTIGYVSPVKFEEALFA
jgi:transposase InsO family protein